MNKPFKSYSVIWLIVLVLFNVIAFVIPSEVNGISKFTGSFWAGYIFITLAFIGQLICAHFAFKAENIRKLFYNIPLVRISYIGLVVMLTAGALAMGIPGFPIWLAIIVCCTILALTVIGVISASHAAEAVESIDVSTQQKTAFIREITMRAESLNNRAGTPETRELCERVYKALKYSDPVSGERVIPIENEIENVFKQFETSVSSADNEDAPAWANELLRLISERNNAVKLFK